MSSSDKSFILLPFKRSSGSTVLDKSTPTTLVLPSGLTTLNFLNPTDAFAKVIPSLFNLATFYFLAVLI